MFIAFSSTVSVPAPSEQGFAQNTRFKSVLCFQNCIMMVMIKSTFLHHPYRLTRSDHFPRILQCASKWLFNQHVLATLHCGHRDHWMKIRRCTNDNRISIRKRNQLPSWRASDRCTSLKSRTWTKFSLQVELDSSEAIWSSKSYRPTQTLRLLFSTILRLEN